MGAHHRNAVLPWTAGADIAVPAAVEVLKGERSLKLLVGIIAGIAFVYHLSAKFTGPRPHVYQPVGGPDNLFVVLDHDHGVAKVAETLEHLD